jgi:hypothetical protein
VNTVLLLVTWFVYGQAPSSYQVQFSSLEACQNARLAIVAESQRLRSEADSHVSPGQVPGFNRSSEGAPFVSAVCARL